MNKIELNGTFRAVVAASVLFTLATVSFADDPDLWSKATQGGERNELTLVGVPCAFRYCPPTGADGFLMGSPEDEEGRTDEEPQHSVVLTDGFWLMETEVTQRLYKAASGKNPSFSEGKDRPVEFVSWTDCVAFIEKLNADGCAPDGWRFCLPTEAQWEYACRAGSAKPYGETSLDDCAWYADNSNNMTHDVGLKSANAWGLFDMLGNVAEWCGDYNVDYPIKNALDPKSTAKTFRAVRGGGCVNFAKDCRAAARGLNVPAGRNERCGMRIALVRK